MYNKEDTKEAEEILQRISERLQKIGRTQSDLIAYLGLPKGTYSSWKAGRSRNFCEHLRKIATFLITSTEYLITGNVTADSKEEELLIWFRKLDDEKKNSIIQNIKWIAK